MNVECDRCCVGDLDFFADVCNGDARVVVD